MATATWDGPFVDIDPLTLRTMVQMQLEDSEEFSTNTKGKQREGIKTDAQLAMEIYVEDLKNCDTYLQDRNMAQSVAMAILQDGDLIAEAYRQEQQVARDRELAMRMTNGERAPAAGPTSGANTRPKKMQKKEHKDPWEDPEMLEKVAAIYMRQPELEIVVAPDGEDQDSDGTVAESSLMAASRKRAVKRPRKVCIACGDEKEFYEVARVPCNHEYCRSCLENLFTLSMKDESLFPPRCDNQEIPLETIRFFLPTKVANNFEARYNELNTKNKTYCHERSCAAFIPAEGIDDDVGACPRCGKTTCTMCKGPSHTGDCPEDEALQQLLATADTQQWQRCRTCRRVVELDTGCNHITCKCGNHFCYVCGVRWKQCHCPQWDEPRLLQRAEQIVDRNPNRQLFRPERIAHAQPDTRPASPIPNLPTQPALLPAAAPQVTSPVSAWEDDFSDHSDWEQQQDVGRTDDRAPHPVDELYDDLPISPTPAAITSPEPSDRSGPDVARAGLIAQAMEHLRDNHACTHDKWRFVKGIHQCEECRHTLKEFIFECRQCHLQACRRCRRNRL